MVVKNKGFTRVCSLVRFEKLWLRLMQCYPKYSRMTTNRACGHSAVKKKKKKGNQKNIKIET